LQYLCGTKDYGITYQKAHKDECALCHGYADAVYANTDDLKSTSGCVYMAAGGAVTWRSKKQAMIALSSTEAEYVVLSKAG
jgi:hypothetical protein